MKSKKQTGSDSEAHVLAEIMLVLGQRPDVRVWRANVVRGVAQNRDGSTRQISAGVKGQGDLIGFVRVCGVGIHLEIEAKHGKRKQTPEQATREEIVGLFGGIYIVARSGGEANDALEKAIVLARERMSTNDDPVSM